MWSNGRIAASLLLLVAVTAGVCLWGSARAQVPGAGLPPVGPPPSAPPPQPPNYGAVPSVDAPLPPLDSPPTPPPAAPPRSATPTPATPPVRVSSADAPVAAPVGQWERVIAGSRVVLHVDARQLTGTITVTEDGNKVTVQVRADHGTTKDSLLYGVITNISVSSDKKDGAAQEEIELQKELLDWPFSVRFRVDGDTLTVRGVNVAFPKGRKDLAESAALLFGTYKRPPAAVAAR